MPAIIDTSAVVAALDRRDPDFAAVTATLAKERSVVFLPVVALPEVAYVIASRRGHVTAASAIGRIISGSWPIAGLEGADLHRAAELMGRYADAQISFVDAAITALAERLGAVRIYTLDRRDFSILRPRHVDAFEILPSVS